MRWALLVCGLSFAAVPSIASAYVPPTRFLVERAQSELSQVRVKTVHLTGKAWSDDRRIRAVNETWSFGPTPRFESTVVDSTEVNESSNQPATADAQAMAGTELSQPVRVVLSRLFSGAGLSVLLSDLGILAEPRRLTLRRQRVAIIIGAEPTDLKTPQVWIDQDSFRILRLVIRAQGDLFDLELSDWNTPTTRGVFPHRVKILKNGRPLRTFTTKKVEQ